MSDYSFEDKMKCAQRELVLRKNVYPARVKLGKMKTSQADREIAIMEAIHADYAFLVACEKAKGCLPTLSDMPSKVTPGKPITSAARQRGIFIRSSRRGR